jgi:hypothetical protein
MGITRIANVTGLDRIGVPVVMVWRPNSRSLAGRQFGWTGTGGPLISIANTSIGSVMFLRLCSPSRRILTPRVSRTARWTASVTQMPLAEQAPECAPPH